MKETQSLLEIIKLPEVQAFMKANEQVNTNLLSLKFSNKVNFDMGAIAQQMELRNKASKKINSFLRPFTLLLPKLYEQCTHEIVAKYKSQFIKGNTLLDGTTGLGMDAYFIGKNFKRVTCLEANPDHAEILKHNYEQLNFKAEILSVKLEEFLISNTKVFDVIYIDPDRRPGANRKLFEIEACEPNVIALKNQLLDRCSELWIKLSPMMDINAIISSFSPNVNQLICIAFNNEMKEILVCLKPEAQIPLLTATNITLNSTSSFTSANPSAKPLLSTPQAYFFEPNLALVKSRLCMEYAVENNLNVLYPNGFFFTTNNLLTELQGRIFEIVEVIPYKNELLKIFIKKNGIEKANINCRNFFWKPEEVKKQLKLIDGGEWYLFCFNNAEKKPIAIWCKKLNKDN